MAASKASISSMALIRIGEQSITDLADSAERARKCNALYDQIRDEVLEAHDWGFSRKRTTLDLYEEDPNDLWGYSYNYPTDCIRMIRLQGATVNDRPDFVIEGNKIFTNVYQATGIYTYRNDTPSTYPPGFIRCFVGRFAAELAIAIREEKTLSEEMWQLYFQTLRDVTNLESSEPHSTPEIVDPWLGARS